MIEKPNRLTVDHVLNRVDFRGVRESFSELFAQVVKDAKNGWRIIDAFGTRFGQQALA
jgi:hypothetical protein